MPYIKPLFELELLFSFTRKDYSDIQDIQKTTKSKTADAETSFFFVEAFYSHASNYIIKVVSIVQAYVKSDFVYKFF